MMRIYCKSKIHKARITDVELDYDGSAEIDTDLMEAADIAPWEQVQVVNLENGERFWTYAIPGERGTGKIALKGPAARRGMPGDRVIIITYAVAQEDEWGDRKPITVLVDEKNRIKEIKK